MLCPVPQLTPRDLRLLMEATRLIHSHGQGPLHERLFTAMRMVFADCMFAFQIYGKDGSHLMQADIPFPEAQRDHLYKRSGELARLENPIYPLLIAGETDPVRLSDLMSLRELRKTDLYQEVMTTVAITRQLAIGVQGQSCLGALTINRGERDFTPEEQALAGMLGPHIATAFETDLLINSLKPPKQKVQATDFGALRRLGLTRREAEVMMWLMEGKRDGEIAIILNASVRTVSHHVGVILGKLRVETRTAAVAAVLKLIGD